MQISGNLICYKYQSKENANEIISKQKDFLDLINNDYIIQIEDNKDESQLISRLKEGEKKAILLSEILEMYNKKENKIDNNIIINKILLCKKIIQLIFKIIKKIINKNDEMMCSALYDDPKKIICYLNTEKINEDSYIKYDKIEKIKLSTFDINNIYPDINGTTIFFAPPKFQIKNQPIILKKVKACRTFGELAYKILFNEDLNLESRKSELMKYDDLFHFINYCFNINTNNCVVYFSNLDDLNFIKKKNFEKYEKKLRLNQKKNNISLSVTIGNIYNNVNKNDVKGIPEFGFYKVIYGNSYSIRPKKEKVNKEQMTFLWKILEQEQIKIVNKFLIPEQIPIYNEKI